MDLLAYPELSRASTGPDEACQDEVIRPERIEGKHGWEDGKDLSRAVGLIESGEGGGPGDEVLVGHFVEQVEGIREKTAFPIRIQEGVEQRLGLGETELEESRM